MLEKEVKIRLSEEEYKTVMDLFEWNNEFWQTNYYYANVENIGGDNDLTIRVRQLDGKYFLQIKKPVVYKGSLHIKKEVEKVVAEIPKSISSKELYEFAGVECADVELLGSLSTLRMLCNWSSDIEICLDKSEYFNKVDYELEIEFTGEYPTNVMSILKERNIVSAKSVLGKFSRFMETYLKSRKESSTK